MGWLDSIQQGLGSATDGFFDTTADIVGGVTKGVTKVVKAPVTGVADGLGLSLEAKDYNLSRDQLIGLAQKGANRIPKTAARVLAPTTSGASVPRSSEPVETRGTVDAPSPLLSAGIDLGAITSNPVLLAVLAVGAVLLLKK